MLKDCLGREIKIDDLICATVRKELVFGRVIRMTAKTIELMMLQGTMKVWIDRSVKRGNLRNSRPSIEGDIVRCINAERCMIVNGIEGLEYLFEDEAAIRDAGFERMKNGD